MPIDRRRRFERIERVGDQFRCSARIWSGGAPAAGFFVARHRKTKRAENNRRALRPRRRGRRRSKGMAHRQVWLGQDNLLSVHS